MSSPIDKPHLIVQKNFWDRLQFDITSSGQNTTQDDINALLERSFLFNFFFRGYSPSELSHYQKLLGIKDNGYVILLQFSSSTNPNISSIIGDEFEFHKTLKAILSSTNNIIGPMIANRLSLLITTDAPPVENVYKEESIALCHHIIHLLESRYSLEVYAFIGTMQSIYDFYTSYIHTLSCQSSIKNNKVVHCLDRTTPVEDSTSIDYLNIEQHLFESVRQHKQEAYNYFGILMDWLASYDDDIKRSKIFELLTLVTFAQRFDGRNEIGFIDYSTYIKQFNLYSGDELIQNAFQRFLIITNYFHTQNTIDYSNDIVKTTREYLENHYTEDISLDDIAAQVNISPQYFSKLIKKTTGFNFIDWLSMLRVRKAKELLTNSNLTVKEVCFMVGYKDPNYFSRIFKKRNGMTPSEYVKSLYH